MSKLTVKGSTMSSVELIDVINEMRKKEKKPILRHDNFMKKIESHPAIQSPKFLGDYKDDRGRTYPCYHLPKFECELMVMSESREVQARVLKRLVVLEEEAATRMVVRTDSSTAYRVMSDMVFEVRDEVGKSCKPHHYSNEALMINEILFGVRKAIDRDSLSIDDLNKLIKMEMRNARLIGRGLPYADRKDLLKQYHEQLLLTPPPKAKMLKEKRA
jgi:hypothetical protein